MSETTFFDWLMQQTKRDDAVGDFASDTRYTVDTGIGSLPSNPNNKTAWKTFLDKLNVSRNAYDALDKAWGEYESDDPYKNTPNVNKQSSLGL